MKILGVICARGGSRGVKDKNIRNLRGIPLIAYTINTLKKWGKADRIILSTDSSKIAKIANEYGAETPFLRPADLASDTSPKIPVLQHALRYCEEEEGIEYDVIVDLQPTSPLRNPIDIDNAFSEFIKTKADVLYSVTESKKSPYFTMVELDDNGNARLIKKPEKEIFRRQDAPKVYTINGSIYVYRRDFLVSTKGLHCEKERVYLMDELSSIDIDQEIDFQFIEFLLERGFFEFK